MTSDFTDVIIENDLSSLTLEKVNDYIAHIYCYKGDCKFVFNQQTFNLTQGNCAIITIPSLVSSVIPSKDFQVCVIYVSNSFIALARPENNYDIKGSMLLFNNPVMPLREKDSLICKRDFLLVKECFDNTEHRFYKDSLIASLRLLFIDFFHFHSVISQGENNISAIQGALMSKFLSLLQQGEYKRHRQVSYYADKLCVTNKYLSETTKKISGRSALFWINRFTIVDIQKRLRDTTVPLSHIAEEFNFSSVSYFSRYVYNSLGQYPSYYREK